MQSSQLCCITAPVRGKWLFANVLTLCSETTLCKQTCMLSWNQTQTTKDCYSLSPPHGAAAAASGLLLHQRHWVAAHSSCSSYLALQPLLSLLLPEPDMLCVACLNHPLHKTLHLDIASIMLITSVEDGWCPLPAWQFISFITRTHKPQPTNPPCAVLVWS